MRLLLLSLFLLASIQLSAQRDSSEWQRTLAKYNVKASFGAQIWAAYSTGFLGYTNNSSIPFAVEDRLDFQFHRGRFSVDAEPYERLQFKLTAAFDFIGRDLYSSVEAGNNNGPSPIFRLWFAYARYKFLANADALHLTAGYQLPNIGRESMNGALIVPSFEKAWSQNYLRRHLFGTGPGRSSGLNLGGMFGNAESYTRLSYDFGIFRNNGDLVSVNVAFAPVVVGRVAVHIADPEFSSYTTSHKVNYFGERNGLTIAFSAAQRPITDNRPGAAALGGDFLFNQGPLNFDGDFHYLYARDELVNSRSHTGYLRASFNLNKGTTKVLEPAVMYWWFNGPLERTAITDANRLGAFDGSDSAIDIGINYHFNPKLKLSIHYTFRDGDTGDQPSRFELPNNNYFRQVGLDHPIQRGDYLGFGLVARF